LFIGKHFPCFHLEVVVVGQIRFPDLGMAGLLLFCIAAAGLGTGGVFCFILAGEADRRTAAGARQISAAEVQERYGAMNMKTTRNHPFERLSISGLAPEFTLPDALDQHPVRLADFRGKKPVLLLFGSFGCDVFCGQVPRLNKLYQTYKDRIQFLFIYITEAHHAWQLPPPTPVADKGSRILRGIRHFRIAFPCLIGSKDVELSYSPFPERLLFIDRSGRIVQDAGVGLPKGWDFAQVESWLKKVN
jgi:iodothyronine deiodinase-like protein